MYIIYVYLEKNFYRIDIEIDYGLRKFYKTLGHNNQENINKKCFSSR